MSSHTSSAQDLSLVINISIVIHGRTSLTRFSLSTSTCSSLSFPSTSCTASCTLSSTTRSSWKACATPPTRGVTMPTTSLPHSQLGQQDRCSTYCPIPSVLPVSKSLVVAFVCVASAKHGNRWVREPSMDVIGEFCETSSGSSNSWMQKKHVTTWSNHVEHNHRGTILAVVSVHTVSGCLWLGNAK